MTSTEWFEKLAAGIQHTIIAIGVIASGVWALFNFILSETAKQEAELREQTANPFPVVYLERICLMYDGNRWLIAASVEVNNKSTSRMKLGTSSVSFLSVARVSTLTSGAMQLRDISYGVEGNFLNKDGFVEISLSYQTEIIARPGEVASSRFIIPVETTGLHQITFHADHVEGRLAPDNRNVLVTEFIYVPETHDADDAQQCVAG